MTNLPKIITETPILRATPIGWAAYGMRASERAYTGFLDHLRYDVARDMFADAIKKGYDITARPGTTDAKVFNSIARFINTTTGRGDIHKLASAAQELNATFWSPRFIKARLDVFNPVYYASLQGPARKEMIKGLLEMIGTGTTILILSRLAGAKVELDPRSSDFGKIQIGNTRFDIWGGHQQYVRVVAQLLSNRRKTSKGAVVDLGGKQFPFETRKDVLERFIRGKLAPVPQLAMELFEGQKMYGDKIMPLEEIRDMVIPMVVEDVIEALKDFGPAALVSVGVPAVMGVGVQTYEEGTTPRQRRKTARPGVMGTKPGKSLEEMTERERLVRRALGYTE